MVEKSLLNSRKLAMLATAAFAYILFVPIIPFHYYYNVDANDFSTIEQVYHTNTIFFDAFSRPIGIPLSSANFGIWGFQSISASLLNFGVVNDAVCGFNPATANVYGPGLLSLTVPITILAIVGLLLLLLKER
jgi:hypothetical protein